MTPDPDFSDFFSDEVNPQEDENTSENPSEENDSPGETEFGSWFMEASAEEASEDVPEEAPENADADAETFFFSEDSGMPEAGESEDAEDFFSAEAPEEDAETSEAEESPDFFGIPEEIAEESADENPPPAEEGETPDFFETPEENTDENPLTDDGFASAGWAGFPSAAENALPEAVGGGFQFSPSDAESAEEPEKIVAEDRRVRCPGCEQEYFLSELIDAETGELLDLAALIPAGVTREAAEYGISGGFGGGADFGGAGMAFGASTAAVGEGTAPKVLVRRSAGTKKKSSPVKTVISTIFGGLMAFPLAHIILMAWFGDARNIPKMPTPFFPDTYYHIQEPTWQWMPPWLLPGYDPAIHTSRNYKENLSENAGGDQDIAKKAADLLAKNNGQKSRDGKTSDAEKAKSRKTSVSADIGEDGMDFPEDDLDDPGDLDTENGEESFSDTFLGGNKQEIPAAEFSPDLSDYLAPPKPEVSSQKPVTPAEKNTLEAEDADEAGEDIPETLTEETPTVTPAENVPAKKAAKNEVPPVKTAETKFTPPVYGETELAAAVKTIPEKLTPKTVANLSELAEKTAFLGKGKIKKNSEDLEIVMEFFRTVKSAPTLQAALNTITLNTLDAKNSGTGVFISGTVQSVETKGGFQIIQLTVAEEETKIVAIIHPEPAKIEEGKKYLFSGVILDAAVDTGIQSAVKDSAVLWRGMAVPLKAPRAKGTE